MYTVFIVVEIIVSALLVIVILMQASKGGGLAGSLGGSNLGTVFGVRRASDFLSKTTTVLATLFIVLALFINLTVLPRGERQESVIQSVPPPSTLPPSSTPAAQPSQPAASPAQQQPENR
ncbi:MAG: preprotein translocase subunit SecG [Ignavibacteriae bacterium]|nr:preprotein translocase subunit SecG [Ignavibacteriota bacterium]